MQHLAIGTPCPMNCPSGLSIMFDDSGFLVGVKLDNLQPFEIMAFKNRKITISLCKVTEQLLFFVFSIDGCIKYSDVAFTINRTRKRLDALQEMPDGKGYAMTMMLVQGNNNILKAMRLVGLSTTMSNRFNEICREQATNPISYDEYLKLIFACQSEFTSKELIDKFEVARCEFSIES